MIRLAANLSFLFGELPFLERFGAAKSAGFDAVEFTFVYDMPPGAIAQQCRAHRLRPILLNAPPGNLALGESGMAAVPGREEEARTTFLQALHVAKLIGSGIIHYLAGNVPPSMDPEAMERTFVANLRWAADHAAAAGIIVTIEPLNAFDRPTYFLRTSDQAVRVLEKAARPNLKLQLDLYHYRLTEGDPRHRLHRLLPWTGHVQVAGAPGRHEPDSGGVDHRPTLAALDRLGYAGHVGCEYLPAAGTLAGLGWAKTYLNERPRPPERSGRHGLDEGSAASHVTLPLLRGEPLHEVPRRR